MQTPLERLRYLVSGAIARGEAKPFAEQPARTPFRTQSAYVSGAICGRLWWPAGAMGGTLINEPLPSAFKRCGPGASFNDALSLILCERGGDFQGASFTADTVVRIERVGYRNGARYVHVFEREIRDLYDCAGLADADCYVCDFFGDDD